MNNSKFWSDGPPMTSDFFSHIVTHRGLDGSVTDPTWPDSLSDPFLMTDMDVAVERVWDAVKENTCIGIVGDYDMDGTPAAALLKTFFDLIGVTTHVILPTRTDGYGFSNLFVDRLSQAGVTLIITVDCGITSHSVVEYAKTKNIDVVITDHHQCSLDLPQAVAVVNPERDNPEAATAKMCGTGVAFKLVQALIQRAPEGYKSKIPTDWLPWTLDLVALATLGDMVPLQKENRILVQLGIKILRRARRLGLRRFMSRIELDPDQLTYRDCVYKLIPKFNSAGRIDHMEDVLTLFTSHDEKEIDRAIEAILIKQTQSRIILDGILAAATVQVEALSPDIKLIVVSDPSWHSGVTGLVAGQLAQKFQKPTLVLAGTENGDWRGSGRSIGGINLFETLQPLQSRLSAFGGHAAAVGFSLTAEAFEVFCQELLDLSVAQDSNGGIVTDGSVMPGEIRTADVEKLETLAPWGVAHPEPTWSLPLNSIDDIRWLSNGKHAKLRLRDYPNLEVMVFDVPRFQITLDAKSVAIFGSLGINEFRGKKTPQLIVQGIKEE